MNLDPKRQAIKNLLTHTNTTPQQLLFPYNKTIPNTNLNQQQLFINLITNNPTPEQTQYIQTVCDLPHKDWRTPTQYARDLVITWLLEDLTQTLLTQHKIPNRKNGADQNRQFLPPQNITPHSDLQILYNNQTRNLETIYDHTQHWNRTNQIDLRLQKHQHLTNQNAILLAIDTQNLTATIINYTNPPPITQRQHPTYGKTVNTITITNPLQPINTTLQQLHSNP